MPRGTPREKTQLLECRRMLRKTLECGSYHRLPPGLDEYWAANGETLGRLIGEAPETVRQAFMEGRRSVLGFARWWPLGDISHSLLRRRLLMHRTTREGGEERRELADTGEVREMLVRQATEKRGGRKPGTIYAYLDEDEAAKWKQRWKHVQEREGGEEECTSR